jgi:cytochrome P450
MRVSALPPGPAAPPLAQTVRWLLAPIEFMESCRRRYGDAFSVRFLGFEQPMVMISDPRAIRALYAEPEHGLPPGRTIALRPIMGARSVLLLEGAAHLERRRVMLPAFHGERMRAYELTMREIAEEEIDRWPLHAELALHPRMRAITLEVILRVVFGVTDEARLERLRELLPRLLDATSSVSLSFRVMLARRLGRADPLASFGALSAEIDALLMDDIAARRGAGATDDERGDVLSLLLAARFEDGSQMSDRELRDQLVTLLLAGHETTATALAWTFDLLLHNPAALERLTAELREDGGDRYLRAVIAESLRLRPVVPLAGRRLAGELRSEDLALPPGTDVTPAIWLTHTRADLYPAPYAFRPERFLEHAPATYAWIPFGGGMRVVLSAVLGRLDLVPVSARSERVQRRNITFSPRHGTRVRVAGRLHTFNVHSSPRPSNSASTRGSAAAVRRQDPSAP